MLVEPLQPVEDAGGQELLAVVDLVEHLEHHRQHDHAAHAVGHFLLLVQAVRAAGQSLVVVGDVCEQLRHAVGGQEHEEARQTHQPGVHRAQLLHVQWVLAFRLRVCLQLLEKLETHQVDLVIQHKKGSTHCMLPAVPGRKW